MYYYEKVATKFLNINKLKFLETISQKKNFKNMFLIEIQLRKYEYNNKHNYLQYDR